MDSCGSYIWENWDETWDSPTLKWTLCSQKTGYIWLSCAFLWILSPIEFRRASFLTSDWKRVPYTLYSMLRFFINLTLIALSGVWLVYALPFQSYDAWMNIWTPAMTLLSYSLALLLLKRNHDKGLESSGILFLFWLFTAIGAVSSYVYDVHELITNQEGWLTSSESYIYSTCVASLSVTEFILHCFSEHIPHKFIFGETVEPWPEYSAPFLSKITFNWVNSSFSHTILHHSKKDTIIEPPPGAKTEDLSQHFSIKYSANQNITACLRKMYWKSALSSAILRLVSVILLFANVVLFSQLLTCIINNDPKWHGFFYVGVMFVVQLVESLVRTQAQYKIETVAVKVRTSLNGAIYEKTLKLSCKSRTDYSPVAIANMVATDSMKIFNFMTTINCFWEIPVQIGIAVYLLWQTIGVACLSSIAVLAFFIPLTSTFESEYKIEAVRSRRAKDKRLKLLNEILAGFHVIKMYAWENSIVNHLLKHRNNEIARMKTQCFYLTGITWNVASGPLLVTLASLLTFSLLGNSLDPLNVFVTMVLLNIIRGPARLISKVISSTSEYRASAKRLETFLDAEEAKDDTVKRLSDDKFSVTVGRGYFSWRADVDMTLEDINLRIRKGSFVAVIGGELSGKSSLLSALLGDMYVNRGVVNIDGTIAYLPRRPWVRKASIKENILFTSAYDEERYKTVIDACFLREVLDNCSEGDETEVTEEFSASANCRINLARALYSNRSVYLLNDPLDCVDEIVAKNIYDNVFGPEGMLQEKTRILVTRQMSILPKTDLIVMLKEGKIVAQGQFQELLKSNNEFFMESIGEYLDLSNSDAGEFEEEIRQAFGRPLAESSSSSLKFSKAAEIAKHTKAWTRVSTKAQVTDSSRGPKLSIYSAYISLLGFSYLAVILITYSIGCGMNIWTLTWLSDWSSEASNGGQLAYSVSQRQLDYALLALGTVLALLASSWIVYSATVHASDLLHSKMVNQVLGTSNSFFAKQPAGNTSNQFDRTLDAVDTSLRVNLKQSSDFFLRLILSIAVISLVMPVFLVALLPL
ncbi:Multidrug resistance-associated protein 1 [Halotydeus destructor]|nr:Multidrug resistance-associated protein 1 [Halotydeus destructor]